jgi:hypothetical protein
MSTFASLITVKSYNGEFTRRLTQLGLSLSDQDAIARSVRREAGPEGAVITERQQGYDVDALAPHWRRLSGALRQAEQRQDKDLTQSPDEPEGEFLDKETPSDALDIIEQEQRLKELRHRYRSRNPKASFPTKSGTKSLGRPTKVKHMDCHCGGSCGSCQFDKCFHLGEELTKLDLALDLVRQEMQVQEIDKQAKAALSAWQGKALDNGPSVDEVCLKIKLLRLQDQRSEAFDALASAGCSILRQDRR